MKQIKYLLMAFIALFACVSFSACSDDDEGGGFTGNYVPVTSIEDWLRDWGEDDPSMWKDKECQLGAVSFNFMNGNTVEKYYAEAYTYSRSDAFYKGNVQGHTYSLVKAKPVRYTFAVKGNKVYITDGTIGTIYKGYIIFDGLTNSHQKMKS